MTRLTLKNLIVMLLLEKALILLSFGFGVLLSFGFGVTILVCDMLFGLKMRPFFVE